MTALRTLEDAVSNPSGFSGTDYTTKARTEIEGLWNAVISEASTVGGSGNAITATCDVPLIGSYVQGQTFRFTPTAGNTGSVTVNFDSKGAVALRQPDGTALVSGDIVSGQPVECWYDTVAGYMRMSEFSQAYIAAATLAAVSGSLQWVSIGDTTISGATANVEHTFIANSYAKIIAIYSDVAPATGTPQLNVTLRNAGGAIVTLASAVNITQATGAVEFICGVVATTKIYVGSNIGYDSVLGVITGSAGGSNVSAADRVRYAFGSGNIASGRLITKGLTV